MTTIIIMKPGVEPEVRPVEVSEKPDYRAISRIVRPLLDGNDLEHVTVLHEGKRADLFVDEMSAVKRLPRNEAATAIYRNNWLTQHPGTDPETLPAIYGPAILFSRRIWF